MIKIRTLLLLLTFTCLSVIGFGQSDRGRIIKPASPVLDPNGDGFVSQTNQGFSFDGYYVDEFEIFMFGIPKLEGDVTGDNIGNNCGITDLTPDQRGFSVYAVRDNNNNLIFRFRVGDDNPSVESWTILLDTDGLFGANDPNATEENPGFEIDITLIKNVNKGVLVYDIDGIDSCPSAVLSYPFSTHFQIAIADEVTCGDPDYFYDFFVPFGDLTTLFGIQTTTGLRYAAVSNVSATCAMAGKISDVSGVDNTDPEYADCVSCAFQNLVTNQCPTPVLDLCETCPGFSNALVDAPTIDTPVRAGQPQISGTAEPGVYIIVEIYSRIGGTDTSPIWDTTPREIKNTFANSSGIWIVTLSNPLQSFDRVVAKAQIDEFSVPCSADGDNSASASVTVVEPNEPPIANSQNLNTLEDTALGIVLTGTDPDGDIIIYEVVSAPAHGVISGSPPNIVYTPNADFNGNDSFTFQVSDGIYEATTPGTITITIQAVNDSPVALDQTITVTEDVPQNIVLSGTDVDGDPLSFSVTTNPTHGTLTGTAPNLVYTPDANFNGSDSFTFSVQDPALASATGTITLQVTGVNDQPVANAQNVSLNEDESKGITLTATDVDGNTLLYSIVNQPLNGTLTGTGSNVVYTPNSNYFGADSFSFIVNDGSLNSDPAVVSLTINPVNDPPIAFDQSLSTAEDTPLSITLASTDVDDVTLGYTIQAQPLNGTLTGTAPNLTYTPDANYNGLDSFTFSSSDGSATSNTAVIFITVNPVNDKPTVANQTLTINEETATSIILSGSDPDGDALNYSLVSLPTHGTISGTPPNIIYTPDLNYFGSDIFTFIANDGVLDSDPGQISITIQSVNDAPFAFDQGVAYQFNTPKAFTLTASDPDNDPLTYEVISLPIDGVITGTAPNLTYTPNSGFTGSDQLTFRVNDGFTNSAIATIFFALDDAINQAPSAQDQNVALDEDTPKTITLQAIDSDGDPLSYTIISSPQHGSLAGSGNVITYSPDLNYNGSDSFTFQATDGSLLSNIATISITINPINDLPFALDQSLTLNEDTILPITLSGSDPESDPLTFSLVTQPNQGILSGSPPSITYTPNANYFGNDQFTFQVNDGSGLSNLAQVSLIILSVNDAPVAQHDQVSTSEDNIVTVNVTANDSDPDGTIDLTTVDLDPVSSIEDKSFSISGKGMIVVDVQGIVTFTPAPDFFGSAVFDYRVKDNAGLYSNVATLTVQVDPVNDAPIPQNAIITVNEDESIQICVVVADAEGDLAFITDIDLVNDKGTVVLEGAQSLCFTFTPEPQFNGQEIALVTICDPDNPTLCNVASITINVIPVNDPPFILVDGLPKTELTYSTSEDTALPFCFEATDIDGDITQIGAFNPVSNGGTLTLQPSGIDNKFCFNFVPNPDFSGSASWTISICDASLCTDISIIIEVLPINDPPIAADLEIELNEDTPTVFTPSATDIEGDVLTFTIIEQPRHGVITGSGPNYTFTPHANYFGFDTLHFIANDGQLDSEAAQVAFTILPVNDAPSITALTLTAKEDSVLQVCLGVIDVDGDLVTFDQPANTKGGGTMTTDPDLNFCYRFTPVLNYNGYSNWQMKACDNLGLCGEGQVVILINPVNDPPQAVDDQAYVLGDASTQIDVLANDRVIADPYQEFYDLFLDRDSIDFLQLVQVQTFNGTASIQSNQITYTPRFEFQGMDSIRYWIEDAGGLQDSAIVKIEVGPAKFRIFEAVSPNGDDLNDYWRINGIEQDPDNEVKIFDRYNNLVFETTNYSNERNHWTGQGNHGLTRGNLPDGTYFYTIYIDLTEDDQGRRLFTGYVILKRN